MKNTLLILFTFFAAVIPASAVLTPVVDSIPMSDGRKLAADIYIPNGIGKASVILIQTPYNRQLARITGLPLGVGLQPDSSDYIFVITDWRGFYGSAKAAYAGAPDRGTDGYTTVEWIAAQPWSNGKVGTWGPSALGKVQFQTAKKNPPHLVCICPVVAAPQFNYLEYYPNGCLRTEYVEQLDALGFGLSAFLLAHPHKDLAWNIVEQANDYADSIRVPALMIGGWYDHNSQLMLDCFEQLRNRSFFNVRSKHKILMGPWVHGGNGPARVGTSNQGELSYPGAANKNDTSAVEFFDFYLRGIQNGWESKPAYTYFQMGEDAWKGSNNWPPSGTVPVRFHLHKGGNLFNQKPQSHTDSASYIYNPGNPSPTVGGPTLRNDLQQGPYDQRSKVENRSDRLIFTSVTFNNDVVMKGNAKVVMNVSSDRPDTDFDVRLCDVYPDGRSMLISDGVMRMRFRNGFTTADTAFMQPGGKYSCVIQLPATCITLKSGHKLRLIITSSNYPRFNRNMNNGNDMYPGGSTDSLSDALDAVNTVHMDSSGSSYVELPLLGYISGMNDIVKHSEGMRVFPNPADKSILVSFSQINSGELIITDAAGREVICIKEFFPDSETDVSALPPGIYFLRVSDGKTVLTARFTK